MKDPKKQKQLNYHDIKEHTNLSLGTISRYFNNGSISEKAKNKIEKYIKETNYQPNLGAKLIKGFDNCVYLIVCNIKETAINDIILAITNSFKQQSINVYVVISSYNHNEYLEALKQTISRKPKTLILLTPIMDKKLRDFINNIEIETYIYGDNSTNKPSITIDEEKMMFNLTSKILSTQKYKKIIYIGKSDKDYSTGKLRNQGFLNAIKWNHSDYEMWSIEDNTPSHISAVISNNRRKLKNPDLMIICGTHTIFKHVIYEKKQNQYPFDTTDIGYSSEFDYMSDTYKYKIFIDFYEIGFLLYNFWKNKEKRNQVIDNFLIIKK